uniref:C2H2-type domain-containing protein n=1 Tax=Lutzomyia longipalpis TaxID=7200 RepID=A0A1B0CR94_LUTLO
MEKSMTLQDVRSIEGLMAKIAFIWPLLGVDEKMSRIELSSILSFLLLFVLGHVTYEILSLDVAHWTDSTLELLLTSVKINMSLQDVLSIEGLMAKIAFKGTLLGVSTKMLLKGLPSATLSFALLKECDKKFKSKQTLKGHIFIHTKLRPYECSFCHKRFNAPHILRRHIYLHTGEKKYKCTLCPMGYIQREGLIRHMATHKQKES